MAIIAASAIVPVVATFGIPLEVRRLAARGTGDRALRTARKLLLLSTPIYLAFAVAIPAALLNPAPISVMSGAAVAIGASSFAAWWVIDTNFLLAQERFASVAALRIAQPVIFVVTVFVLYLENALSLPVVLAVYAASNGMTAGASAALCRVSIRGPRLSYRQLLRGGARVAGSSVAEIATTRLDQIIILPLMGAAQAGYYAVAVAIATVPAAVGQAVVGGYFRDVATATDSRHARRLQGEAAQLVLMLLAPLIIIGLVLTPTIVPLIFGSAFHPSVLPTQILLFGAWLYGTAFVISVLLAATGQGVAMTVCQVLGLALGTGALFALASHGAVGAAWASVIGSASLLGALLIAARVPPQSLVPRPLVLREGARRIISG